MPADSSQPKPPHDSDPLLSPRDLAARLNVSRSAIYNWRATGEGPPSIRLGGLVRYRRSVVEAWLDEQEAASADERVQGRGHR